MKRSSSNSQVFCNYVISVQLRRGFKVMSAMCWLFLPTSEGFRQSSRVFVLLTKVDEGHTYKQQWFSKGRIFYLQTFHLVMFEKLTYLKKMTKQSIYIKN